MTQYQHYRKPSAKGLQIFSKTFGAKLLQVNILVADYCVEHLKPTQLKQYWATCERCLDPNNSCSEVSIDDLYLELVFEGLTITVRSSERGLIGNGQQLNIKEQY